MNTRSSMQTRSKRSTRFIQLPYTKKHKNRRTNKCKIPDPKPEEPDDLVSVASSEDSVIPQGVGEEELDVSIDFDDAHDEWSANKKRLANGNYVYLCGKETYGARKCRRGCCDKIGLYSGCISHFMWEEILHHS